MSWIDDVRFDAAGLVPVVAQEIDTGTVLMVAYADRAALERTAETGEAHYFSRSRAELWRKGATSGNLQAVAEVRLDCDGDAVLYRVRQTGPACHTLEESCFFRAVDAGTLAAVAPPAHVLHRVAGVIAARDETRPADSYTTYLFASGLDKILKKVGEETTEVVIAAKNAAAGGAAAELRSETADLLFHLLVLLRQRGVPLAELWAELDARFGAAPRRTLATASDRPEP